MTDPGEAHWLQMHHLFGKKKSHTVQIVKYRRTRNIHILHYAIDYNPLNAVSEVKY